MGNNIFLSPKETEDFGHALKLINDSLENLKEVFLQMQPEILTRHGLKRTLAELCDLVRKDYQLATDFIFEGNDQRINQSYEIAVYGIAIELISNVIKHANATSMTVQITQNDNRIVLTIKDNGKGFGDAQNKPEKNNGLTLIRTQLKTYQGWMAISSEPGKGSEVVVELNW